MNTCPECGHQIRKYKVKITPMLVHALVKFKAAVVDHRRNEIHLLKDMKGKSYQLGEHEWDNFSRQRFLGLAVKVRDRKGYWLLTKRGNAFLKGEQAIPDFVWVLSGWNKIVGRSENLVTVGKVIGSVPYLETEDNIEYEDVPVSDVPVMVDSRAARAKKMKPDPKNYVFNPQTQTYVEIEDNLPTGG